MQKIKSPFIPNIDMEVIETYPVPVNEENYSSLEFNYDTYNSVEKMLTIGVSVKYLSDEDKGKELAERIAYGKAVSYLDHVLYVTKSGMINTTMVRALLEQEAEHFKKDPGSYLKTYNKDKENFIKYGKVANPEKATNEIINISFDKYRKKLIFDNNINNKDIYNKDIYNENVTSMG